MFIYAPVKIKGKEKFHYEINIDESYADGVVDEWGAAFVWNVNGVGVEYNFYRDINCESSAIYKMDEGSMYYDIYRHYEIDFSDDDWKDKLINEMIDCCKEFWD